MRSRRPVAHRAACRPLCLRVGTVRGMTRLKRRRRLAAAALGFVVVSSAGCAAAPREPDCYAIEGDLSSSAMQCRAAHSAYEKYKASSVKDKLNGGYREAWIPVGILAGVAAAIAAFAASSRSGKDQAEPGAPTPGSPPSPPPAPPQLPSLVGTRVRYRGVVCTIVDDSQPSVPNARINGGRCAVNAADGNGAQGVLFLGFDPAGNVLEAATDVSDWAPAVVVS